MRLKEGYVRWECEDRSVEYRWYAMDLDKVIGVHIWCSLKGGKIDIGGVELHRDGRAREETGCEARHKDCWLLGGPCNHDGSSTWFRDTFQYKAMDVIRGVVPHDSLINSAARILRDEIARKKP